MREMVRPIWIVAMALSALLGILRTDFASDMAVSLARCVVIAPVGRQRGDAPWLICLFFSFHYLDF